MEKFITHTGIAAPLPVNNVDTDKIIPKQFLRTIKRSGLGVHAFHEDRYYADGLENPDFVLNRKPYRNASILITGENFGCGSSREHAPWALQDFGFRCIIASGYADIFYNNSFKNGILPIALPKKQVDILMERAQDFPSEPITVDLESQQIQAGNHIFDFEIDPFRKKSLMEGLDEIGETLKKDAAISDYEHRLKENRPWLFS